MRKRILVLLLFSTIFLSILTSCGDNHQPEREPRTNLGKTHRESVEETIKDYAAWFNKHPVGSKAAYVDTVDTSDPENHSPNSENDPEQKQRAEIATSHDRDALAQHDNSSSSQSTDKVSNSIEGMDNYLSEDAATKIQTGEAQQTIVARSDREITPAEVPELMTGRPHKSTSSIELRAEYQ